MKTEAIRLCIQSQYGKEDYTEARKELKALLDRLSQLEAAQQSVQADATQICGCPLGVIHYGDGSALCGL